MWSSQTLFKPVGCDPARDFGPGCATGHRKRTVAGLQPLVCPAIGLRARYAMPGTDMAYGATRDGAIITAMAAV
eukprot:1057551-Rhodomonas_salina.1